METKNIFKSIYFKIFVVIAMVLAFWYFGSEVKAGSITLNNLDFEIQLNEDGSMDVTENWDARIYDTNTMFKAIHMNSTKFKEITDVEVYRVNSDGTKTKLRQIDEEMYHVTENCYYGLVVSSGDFEIAWGVSVEGRETRKYQIKYKVVDAVKTYNDCSELYWQLVGNENGLSVDKLTATILLPKAVQNSNNLRAWAHGPYNGNVYPKTDRVTLSVDYLDPEVMVEVRLAVLEDIFSENTVIPMDRLNTILLEENHWAEEANHEREEYIKEKQRQEIFEKIMIVLIILFNIGLTILFIVLIIKASIRCAKTPKRTSPYIDYFRDIPDKTSSAGDAALLYYNQNGKFSKNLSKVISATMLQLALKKYIVFSEDKTGKKPDVRVSILNYSENVKTMLGLKKDEQIVYNLLVKVANSTKEEVKTFTMKEMEKYAKKHSSTFVKSVNKIEKEVRAEQARLGNYDKKIQEQKEKELNSIKLCILFGIVGLYFTFLPAALLFIKMIPHIILYNKLNPLTDKGLEEAAKWNGLKRYMEDFSLLNEKEVPDLKLWEKYLVFATAFGIADKVIDQLKVKYPDLQEIDGYDYVYMNLLYSSALNTAFLTSLNTAVNRAYMGGLSNQAGSNYSGGNFSSGGGFGGGFSGGGGFGGGGGRHGWKINFYTKKESSNFARGTLFLKIKGDVLLNYSQ